MDEEEEDEEEEEAEESRWLIDVPLSVLCDPGSLSLYSLCDGVPPCWSPAILPHNNTGALDTYLQPLSEVRGRLLDTFYWSPEPQNKGAVVTPLSEE